jgi:hypothetical protein
VSPSRRHAFEDGLAGIACALREWVERPVDALCRLVGVDLAGFIGADSSAAQWELSG